MSLGGSGVSIGGVRSLRATKNNPSNSHQNVLNIAKWYQSQRLVLTTSYEYIPPTESSVMGTLLAPS